MTPHAYYNEHDPFAAEWLRNLIKAGHITSGEVDTRSIVDVRPTDLVGFHRCHFFAGIGVWDYALRIAGWPVERQVWTGSCPCQPFSKAGRRGGITDERHLWPAWRRLIEEHRPDAVLGEQVAVGIARSWFDAVSHDLEEMDYSCGAVVAPAACFGAEHIRDRLWFVAYASGKGPQGSVQEWNRPPCMVQPQEPQRGNTRLSARIHPRSDRASVLPTYGSARHVDAVRAFGNAINAEAAAAFIGACMP